MENTQIVNDAYNMLVVFRKISETYPELKTYSPQDIENCYKKLLSIIEK